MQQDPNQNSQEQNPEMEIKKENVDEQRDHHLGGGPEVKITMKIYRT